jgi:hypothetical protein
MPAAVACFDLPLDAMLYGLGEKYGLPDMKALALNNFIMTMQIYPRNVLQNPFREAATIAYDSTPDSDRDLRKAVVGSITRFEYASDCPEIEKLLEEIPALGRDVNSGLFSLVAGLRTYLRHEEQKNTYLKAHFTFGGPGKFEAKPTRSGKRWYAP